MYRMLIGDIPGANARRAPTAMAYVDGGRTFTWADTDERTNRLSSALASALGVRSGDVAAILADNCVEHPELAFACSKSGAHYTGLNTRHNRREMAGQLADCAPSVLFAGPGFEEIAADLAAEFDIPAIGVAGASLPDSYEELIAAPAPSTERSADPDAIYNLSYTSGTTGEPKGAMISNRNMLALARSMGAVGRTVPSDRHLINLPVFHAGGHFAIMHPAYYGLPVVFLSRPDPELTVDAIQQHGITSLLTVPIAMKMLVDYLVQRPEVSVSSLRMVIYGSNPIPVELLRAFAERVGCGLAQIGGIGTEGGIGLALSPEQHTEALADEALAHRLASCGTVQPGAELRLVDEDDRDVAQGELGEMLFRGDSYVSGYWQRPEVSAEAWRGGWFHSGDIGVMDPDGFVTYVDRKSGRIKSGSETVYAREVENALRDLEGVGDVCVVGVADPTWGEAVCAMVELADGAALDEERIRSHAREHLSGYKVPKRALVVPAIPRTALGKAALDEVRAAFAATVPTEA